jgi:dihydroorotate dehydrogenase (NAD+) catalytic subunit
VVKQGVFDWFSNLYDQQTGSHSTVAKSLLMKRDLYFSQPLMNSAGSLGFAPDSRAGIALESLGAFVTNPFSLRPRAPAAKPELIHYPGGFLLHTGLPNPGLNTGIKKYAARWDKSVIPIIVHLMADRPEETQRMVRMLESQENVMAAELGFAPLLADDIIQLTLEMNLGELPLIFSLPVEQVLSLGPRLIQGGAQAISISAPRGALRLAPGVSLHRAPQSNTERGELITGRLYGPSLFPQTLETVHAAAKLGLPIIGAGGVWNKENADSMVSAGALAVQVDAALWGFDWQSQSSIE